MSKKTVCLDFDGVIHSYISGWQGIAIIPDPPVEGTKDAIERLRVKYFVYIHSTRCRISEGREAIRSWLKKYNIVVDDICERKPFAVMYIDNRGIRFRSWIDCMAEIRTLETQEDLEEIGKLRSKFDNA